MHRAKWRELDRDPRAAVVIVAPDGYHWVSVSGRVTLTTDGAMDDIERLSQKYDGHEFRPLGEREVRISGRLDPEHVTGYGV